MADHACIDVTKLTKTFHFIAVMFTGVMLDNSVLNSSQPDSFPQR